jgi:hypothetical protein
VRVSSPDKMVALSANVSPKAQAQISKATSAGGGK